MLINFLIIFMIMTQISAESNIAQTSRLDIFYETFGTKTNPAILLIMGSGGQGILWPDEFCQKLAKQNKYVIRYDLRDAGQSTCFDFEKESYDFLDLAKYAIALLDFLKIEQSELVGLSMGGFIAELLAVHFPERVKSITLISTTCDLHPINLSLKGLPAELNGLPGPKLSYLDFVKEISTKPTNTTEQELERRIEIWNVLNGNKIPLEKESVQLMHKTFLSRQKNPAAIRNYRKAHFISEDLVKNVPFKINVPTTIIHGSEDPIFTPEHGIVLHEKIKNSKFYLLNGMGHILNHEFYDIIINKIVENK